MAARVRFAALVCCAFASWAATADARVVLVGIDGATWNVIDPMMRAGELPNLAALAERGVHADLATVEPVTSPVVWTSIATGRSPDVHGVTDFMKDSLDVGAPTMFERLAAQGTRVGVYDWLVAWPPQRLPQGFVVPGWMRRDDATEPTDALARGGPGYRYRLRGVNGRATYAANVRREIAEKPDQWLALFEAFDVEAGALTFYAVDATSHRFWHDAYPEQFEEGVVPAPEDAYRTLLPEVMQGIDRGVGRIAASLGPHDTLLLASDHGFEAGDEMRRVWSFHTEAALARSGLVSGRDAFVMESQFGYPFIRVRAGDFEARDALLDRLVAFYESAETLSGESLFTVEVIDIAERPEGRERAWLVQLRQWAVGMLLRHFFSVNLSDEDAHAYVLVRSHDEPIEAAWPDGRVRVAGNELPLRDLLSGDGFSGQHHPTAIFLAAGGPIRRLPDRQQLSVLDVAPLYLWLAGSAIPDDLEGTLPRAFLDPAALAARPPKVVDAGDLPRLDPPAARHPVGGDAALVERLRSMGYVE